MVSPTSPSTTRSRPGGAGRLAGRIVSRVGFGAMQLTRLSSDRKTALGILQRAIEAGVDHLDTAQFYGNGFVNSVIREVIGRNTDVVVVSKIGADPGSGGSYPVSAQRPEQLRKSVEDNLSSLGLESIPVVNLRRNDVGFAPPMESDQIVDLDDQLAEMTALRDAGKIGAIGLSSISTDSLRRALPVGIACVQNPYSLLARNDEVLLELVASEGLAWVPYFPLGSAVPSLPKVTADPIVIEIAAEMNVTPAQVGLAWLLAHSANTLLIPGTADAGHLETNLAAGALSLSTDAIIRLDARHEQ